MIKIDSENVQLSPDFIFPAKLIVLSGPPDRSPHNLAIMGEDISSIGLWRADVGDVTAENHYRGVQGVQRQWGSVDEHHTC